ncbi:hypothetical protein Vafri_15300 [Volvox africanus]|uniref:Uncharacterized protein n=1 Tax=Volvox africanus TaxID=51714 RepID=A0A8J4BGK8_9CHLO|nr:hypothetical protein Vafri_15300 [Volvox africanus]
MPLDQAPRQPWQQSLLQMQQQEQQEQRRQQQQQYTGGFLQQSQPSFEAIMRQSAGALANQQRLGAYQISQPSNLYAPQMQQGAASVQLGTSLPALQSPILQVPSYILPGSSMSGSLAVLPDSGGYTMGPNGGWATGAVAPVVQYVLQGAPPAGQQYAATPSAMPVDGVPNIYISTSTPVNLVNPITVSNDGSSDKSGVSSSDRVLSEKDILAVAGLMRRPRVVVVPLVVVGG